MHDKARNEKARQQQELRQDNNNTRSSQDKTTTRQHDKTTTGQDKTTGQGKTTNSAIETTRQQAATALSLFSSVSSLRSLSSKKHRHTFVINTSSFCLFHWDQNHPSHSILFCLCLSVSLSIYIWSIRRKLFYSLSLALSLSIYIYLSPTSRPIIIMSFCCRVCFMGFPKTGTQKPSGPRFCLGLVICYQTISRRVRNVIFRNGVSGHSREAVASPSCHCGQWDGCVSLSSSSLSCDVVVMVVLFFWEFCCCVLVTVSRSRSGICLFVFWSFFVNADREGLLSCRLNCVGFVSRLSFAFALSYCLWLRVAMGLVLSCLVLSCLVLSCLVLSCLAIVLSCLAISVLGVYPVYIPIGSCGAVGRSSWIHCRPLP